MEQKIPQSIKTWIALPTALLALLLVRVIPAIGQPLYVYGYDYGFYRYALQHLAPLNLHTIFTGISGGYSHILFYAFNLLHIPPDAALLGSHFLASILLGAAVFLFLKKYSLITAWLGTLLTAFSLVQLESYTMFLWKTGIALPLFVWGLASLRDKKYIQLTVIALLLLITHRTSAIIFLLTLSAYILITQLQNKQWKWLSLEVIVTGLGILLFWTRITSIWYSTFTTTDQSFVRDGIFFYGQSKLTVVWPFVLLAAYGLYCFYKHRETLLIAILGLITLTWMVLHLPFYNRILLYFDIALIILAAYGLAVLFRAYWHSKLGKILLCIVILFLGYRAAHSAWATPALITQEEINEIKTFKIQGPVPFTLATSANDGPWLLGFLENSRLGAPGLFEDKHTENEWQHFWAGQNQTAFLNSFPMPLYLYQRAFRITNNNQCLKQLSANFLEYICK